MADGFLGLAICGLMVKLMPLCGAAGFAVIGVGLSEEANVSHANR